MSNWLVKVRTRVLEEVLVEAESYEEAISKAISTKDNKEAYREVDVSASQSQIG